MIISGYACSNSREDDSNPRNPLCFMGGSRHTDRHTYHGALKCATESDQIRQFAFEAFTLSVECVTMMASVFICRVHEDDDQ